MDKAYVIVIDRNDDIVPIRHIVTIGEAYDEREFKEWYYSKYTKLGGDEFIYCKDRKARDKFIRML